MLQALVEEKTRALAKSDARLEDVRRSAKREAAADRAEIERLTERLYQEHGLAIQQLRCAVSTIEGAPNNNIQSDTVARSSGKTPIAIPTLSRELCSESNKIHEVNQELKKNSMLQTVRVNLLNHVVLKLFARSRPRGEILSPSHHN